MSGMTETLGPQLTRVPVPAGSLAEGPVWDAAASSLYWVDIPAGRVHRLGPDGGHVSWDAGQPVGAVVPRQQGGLVLAARDGFLTLDPRTGAVTMLAPVESDRPGNRMNDGACDRAGRFYAGTKAEDDTPGAGALYRLDPDHSVHQILSGVTISNGIGWSPGERAMYYTDSPTGRVDLLDYDAASGAVSGRQPCITVNVPGAVPDGLTVDAEGGIWVALWGGAAVHRYLPDGGLDRVLEVPLANVTSCAFGGPDLGVLYVTAAAGSGAPEGALLACRPGVPGVPAHPYRG